MPIPIGLVEDNEPLRRRFVERISFFKDIALTVVADSGEAFLEQLDMLDAAYRPRVVMMDIELPAISGIDTTALLKDRYPDIEVIMLTVFEHEEKIFQSIQAGASGYLLKDASMDTIAGAIHEMLEGGAPMSATVARKLLQHVQQSPPVPEAVPPTETFALSGRELEILEGIVRDDTEAVIAEDLHISPHTVRTHIKNIYKKMHVHSRAAAVRVALENRLL